VRYFPKTVDNLDLVYRVNGRREAAVNTKDLVVDDDGEREIVEHVGKVVPYVGIPVLARAFCVEAIRLCDPTRLVVAADEVHSVRIAQLEADEQRNGLN